LTASVIDASALADLLLRREAGIAVGALLRERSSQLHAPFLCDIEITSALIDQLRQGTATELQIQDALVGYLALTIRRHAQRRLLPRIVELRHNFSPFDAAYVALAERLKVDVITTDRRLARAIRQFTTVEALPA
jgi:predicted nucleic acid-binding protein